ncbi:MAG: hypothetical protein HQL68_05810 [Magnetococcales bacterium]|nr:hypothetical protein [Magnetococcales bacterium]
MSALTAGRKTVRCEGGTFAHPVAAATLIYEGGIVALDAAGNAVPGATATDLTVVGMALGRADNSGGAAGDALVSVERVTARFINDGTDTVDRTHIGGNAYVVDDQTVAATDGTGTRSVAGKIMDLDSDGVWVALG